MYTNKEKLDMLLVYGESGRNAVRAIKRYGELYPDRERPTRQLLARICKKLLESGSWNAVRRTRQKTATGEVHEEGVLALAHNDPTVSSRRIATECGISQRSVLRILHRHRFHPFHLSLHQALSDVDFERRQEFCRFALHRLQDDPTFFQRVLFTDEATFTNHGNVNLHNMHYWSIENPHWLRQVQHQQPWSVNVWCGIVGNVIVGPYFIPGILNGNNYAQFLRNVLPTLLEEVPLTTRQCMWFQHDGCPAHSSRVATELLNETFPDCWIGRRAEVKWPARSPDLTPLDFFLWGAIKHKVYAQIPTTPDDMKQRIIESCAEISRDSLAAVHKSFERRLQMCIAAEGKHFEHMLQ